MTDNRERVWKVNEEGYRYLISRDEHRDIFMLRRKGSTFKAIGDLYQVSGSHARQLVGDYMRRRQSKVFRYLKNRNKRGGEPVTDDLVKRLRKLNTFEWHARPATTKETYFAAADRIEELEAALRFIANINYGNGPDVTMEHQGWAKRALGEKKDD